MEHIVKEIILSNEQRELLLFLYENLHIDELSEEDQIDFIESFMNHETLNSMAPFKSSLVEMIRELEHNLPAIEWDECSPDSNGQKYDDPCKLYGGKRNERKKQTVKKGNIIYVPFNK